MSRTPTSSTARYEFEHNGARERQRAHAHGSHPAGSRHGNRQADGTSTHAQPQSVVVDGLAGDEPPRLGQGIAAGGDGQRPCGHR